MSATGRIRSIMQARAADLFREEGAPDDVKVTRHETVWIAACRFNGRTHTGVIKPVRRFSLGGGVDALWQVHRHLCQADTRLRDSTVRFLGCLSDEHLVVMEHVPGTLLCTAMERALGARASTQSVDHAVQQLGHYQRDLHAVDAAQFGADTARKINAGFMQEMDEIWYDPWIQRRLPPQFRDHTTLHGRLPADFATSCGDRVLPVDLQPKNVIIRPDGRICVIDVDYAVGHPARGLALCLVSFDRLRMRRPGHRALETVDRWKHLLLDAYVAGAKERSVLVSLQFFYPWAVLTHYRQHVGARRWWRPYLAWFYGGLLSRWLLELDRQPHH